MRAKALTHSKIETLPAPRTGISMLPDEQLLCYDYLYYVCSDVVRMPSLFYSLIYLFLLNLSRVVLYPC